MNLEPWWPLNWERENAPDDGIKHFSRTAYVYNHPSVKRIITNENGAWFDALINVSRDTPPMLRMENPRDLDTPIVGRARKMFHGIFHTTGNDDLMIRSVLLTLANEHYRGGDDGIVYG